MPFKSTKLFATAMLGAGLLLSGLSAAYATDKALYGDWVAERIQGHKLKGKVQSTLEIAQDGRISGTGGCNRYMGSMVIEGDKITVKPVGGTMMACPPPMMQQDDKFHKALNSVTSWKINKDRLVLIDSKKREVLRLKRS